MRAPKFRYTMLNIIFGMHILKQKSWHFGMKLVILQQQFLPRLFLKAYHGRTSCPKPTVTGRRERYANQVIHFHSISSKPKFLL